jgi:hypothetical protein
MEKEADGATVEEKYQLLVQLEDLLNEENIADIDSEQVEEM